MKDRARAQEETRRKIVEATMHLHETLGPRATTISAIAEEAGVQRLTVYRHFPDEAAVFQACTSHWLALNPPPDPAGWTGIGEEWERIGTALSAFYGYYGATQAMWSVCFQDVEHVPALQGPMRQFLDLVDGLGVELAGNDASRQRVATLQHSLAFLTWADLDARGLSDGEKVALAVAWLKAV